MRLNKFIAQASGLSRRSADTAIGEGRVRVNGSTPVVGQMVAETDNITLDGKSLELPAETSTILLNKPAGFVVSRDGQGSKTIYDLLPVELHHLKPVGRLDKYSSGLLLLTSDGELANKLTHPRYAKTKIYEITLDTPLEPLHQQMISEQGLQLEDGPSKFGLERIQEGNDRIWRVIMHEGRNRQIRRTFKALGYEVRKLHRTQFGDYSLCGLGKSEFRSV